MRPQNLKTRIFLDGGDPSETKEIMELLGFLDGQTTNPSLIAKSPGAQKRIENGELFSTDEVYAYYRSVVSEISNMLPEGSVSIEVYADRETTVDQMYEQALEMNSWIPNAHIKLPIIPAGLACARKLTDDGLRVNMTLCFSQQQAAAVHRATIGAEKGDVFISPFVGRLDDRGENGMSLIRNIQQMYKQEESHVEVLVASVRSLEHFMAALHEGADIITAPAKILRAWADAGMQIPGSYFTYDVGDLEEIAYEDISQETNLSIQHDLTDVGLEKFAADWNGLIAK